MKLKHLLDVIPWGEKISVSSYTFGTLVEHTPVRCARAELINFMYREVYVVEAYDSGELELLIEVE